MHKIVLTLWGLCVPLSTTLAVGTPPTPTLGGGDPLGVVDLVRVTMSLIVVLAAIVLTTWLLRRFTKLGGTMGGALQVLGGISLGARERIVLVQVGERQILLGIAPGQIQTLHVLEKPLPVPPPPPDFSTALRTLMREKGQ